MYDPNYWQDRGLMDPAEQAERLDRRTGPIPLEPWEVDWPLNDPEMQTPEDKARLAAFFAQPWLGVDADRLARVLAWAGVSP